MDNYYVNCPPKMNDGRFTTNYKSSSSYNEYIKYMNSIVRDDDYRLFLQTNAEKLMDSEWLFLKQHDSCWNNAHIHNYPLRMDPRLFNQEREKYNSLFKTNSLPPDFQGKKYPDYRTTITPLQSP